MVSVERSFTVDRPLPVLVDYLKDFARAEDWDPGTMSCVRLDDGPVRVGSSWRNVSVFRGRETSLVYRLVRWDADHLTFVGENSSVTTTDDLFLRSTGTGDTEVVYRARLDFKGLIKLAEPFLRKDVERLADGVEAVMPGVLARA